MLRSIVGNRASGLLFQTPDGKPVSQRNVLRGFHGVLKRLKIEKAGFHAFRRYRATYLSTSRVPDSLMRFWLGHGNKTITDEYVKLFNEIDYRQEVVKAVGLGFELPPMPRPVVRKVRRKVAPVRIGAAA